MNKDFVIQTKNGNAFDPKTGKLNVVEIDDIAHALSNLSRYAGHCSKFYSVAEHCVLVSRIVRALWPDDIDSIWAGLLHDSTEAYVGDVPTPLKVLLPRYMVIEDNLTNKLARYFNIKWNKKVTERVKIADLIALSTEARRLFKDVSEWKTIRGFDPMPKLLNKNFPVDPKTAKRLFIKEFNKVKQELEK